MTKRAKQREQRRKRRHLRVRNKVFGTPARPRLVVNRSLKNMQGHLVDDISGRVLMGVSTLAPELEKLREDDETSKTELSRAAGELLGRRAREQDTRRVVFDRAGYPYHGRVAAFADGAREGGLEL